MTTDFPQSIAKEIANYINHHCDGVDEGFEEIEYEGFICFCELQGRNQRGCRGLDWAEAGQ